MEFVTLYLENILILLGFLLYYQVKVALLQSTLLV